MQGFYNTDRDTILKATLKGMAEEMLESFFRAIECQAGTPPNSPVTVCSDSIAWD